MEIGKFLFEQGEDSYLHATHMSQFHLTVLQMHRVVTVGGS